MSSMPYQLWDISPGDLAGALAIIENDAYKSLTEYECIYHLQNPTAQRSVTNAIDVNNSILTWVKKSILKRTNVTSRHNAYIFFCDVAQKCYSMKNFSSMMAILGALASAPVARLKQTASLNEKENKDRRKNFNTLQSFLEPEGNHKRYRDLLKIVESKACLPWLALHLKDMYTLNEVIKRRAKREGQALINVEGYIEIYKYIKNVLSHRQYIMHSDAHREKKHYLYAQFHLAQTASDPNIQHEIEEFSSRWYQEES